MFLGLTLAGYEALYKESPSWDANKIRHRIAAEQTSDERGDRTLEHLIYAYMIENTGIYEVFAKVVAEVQNGERLGPVRPDTLAWVRTTEVHFYGGLPLTFPLSVQSSVRPDPRATRRNAYHRLLGMELNDGSAGSAPHPFVRSEAANSQLVTVLESLFREVWVARTNRDNKSGAKPSDDAKLLDLVQHLQSLLRGRRQSNRLDHVEAHAVATMSWFHQAVRLDDPGFTLMQDLQASGLASPEQKLFKIAQLVGHPAHGLSRSFFLIAQPLSDLFIRLEANGAFSDTASVQALYDDGPLSKAMDSIIQHWSIISGRDMKAGRVAAA